MKWFVLAIAVAFTLGRGNVATAAENPTGTWKWTMAAGKAGGQARDVTLKLKLDGDKLTGTISGRNNTDTAIEDATFKDGEIAFTVTRTMGDNKFVSKYTGKVSGDTIKGKIDSDRAGKSNSRDWEAKRSAE